MCDVWDSCPIANQCMPTMQPVLQVLTAASAESVAGSHGEIPCSHGRYGSFVGCPVCFGCAWQLFLIWMSVCGLQHAYREKWGVSLVLMTRGQPWSCMLSCASHALMGTPQERQPLATPLVPSGCRGAVWGLLAHQKLQHFHHPQLPCNKSQSTCL